MGTQTMTFGPLIVTFDERVLRPRPWTLLQAQWVAELTVHLLPGPILELCSGAGSIGQAAARLSGRALVQVDLDPHACELAVRNVEANGLVDVDVRCGDLGAVLRSDERFPVILADPPYLPSEATAEWPDDPPLAVDGGKDGLDLPRRCLRTASLHVAPAGVVLLQTSGRDQLDLLDHDLRAAGLRIIEVREEDEHRAVALLRGV